MERLENESGWIYDIELDESIPNTVIGRLLYESETDSVLDFLQDWYEDPSLRGNPAKDLIIAAKLRVKFPVSYLRSAGRLNIEKAYKKIIDLAID